MNSFLPLADPSKIWGTTLKSVDTAKSNPRRVAVDIMRIFLANKTPITLWGPIGARKTRTIESLANELDENGKPYQVITIQPSVQDPTVIHGIMYTTPDPDTGETIMKRSIPDIAQQVVNYAEKGGLTILFMDEMTVCMPAQQHALLGILTHGQYGDKNIQDHITIAMAANPEGTVSTVNPLGEQVINRGGHIAWFGDVNLFLEEWRSGFGSPSRAPSADVDWYISTLIDQDAEKAFRNERWETGSLVPYELMEHTERATTEQAKLIAAVNQVFANSPDPVRHFYLVEITRALIGNEWADNMRVVCSMESRRVSAKTIIEQVAQNGVIHTWSHDQLRTSLSDSLYYADGRMMQQDQISSVAANLMEAIDDGDKGVDKSAYLAMWAFATTAPNEGIAGGMHSYLVRLMMFGFQQLQLGNMDQSEVRPEFVPEEVRANLKSAFAAKRG